jgi:pyridoxine kinase
MVGVPHEMNILSVQSWVAYGHVGNAAAVFPLQRLGAEVWAVNTVQFSNHTGYGDWGGRVLSGAEVADVIDGIARRGVLAGCDAVLSGYIGDAGIGRAVLGAVGRVKAANPRALYCCDPVIGDIGRGVFVRPDIPDFFARDALPCADIVTPNRFELERLAGHGIATLDAAKQAVAAVQARMASGGPRSVLVTSLQADATPPDAVDLLVAEGGACYLLRTPLLDIAANGAGDVIAALFLFHRLATGSAAMALEAAASALFGVLRRTVQAGAAELLLIGAQEELVAPSRRFNAVMC